MRNQVQLIAYADRLGGTLPALAGILDGPLSGLFAHRQSHVGPQRTVP
jgi:hypothetical protein